MVLLKVRASITVVLGGNDEGRSVILVPSKTAIDVQVIEYSSVVWNATFSDTIPDDTLLSVHGSEQVEALAGRICDEWEQGQEVTRIRHVVLDEEFLVWLEDYERPNNQITRMEYAASLEDEDVRRLWTKNGRTFVMTDYVHFLVVEGEHIPYANFPLPYAFMNLLKALYAEHLCIKPQRIYIHPELQCPDFYLTQYRPYMFEEAAERFAGRLPFRQAVSMDERPHHANVAARVIPVAVCVSAEPIYDADDIVSRSARLDTPFSSDLLSTLRRLVNHLPLFEAILPAVCLVAGSDIMVATELIMAQMKRHAEEEGIAFHVE